MGVFAVSGKWDRQESGLKYSEFKTIKNGYQNGRVSTRELPLYGSSIERWGMQGGPSC